MTEMHIGIRWDRKGGVAVGASLFGGYCGEVRLHCQDEPMTSPKIIHPSIVPPSLEHECYMKLMAAGALLDSMEGGED